jgi:class 3 adenylate cyclase
MPKRGTLALRRIALLARFGPARFGPADWLLIGTIAPFCALIVALHSCSVLTTGLPRLPLLADSRAGRDVYPVAVLHREAPDPRLEIRVGDRLLRAGSTDLAGTNHLSFEAIVRAEAGTRGSVEIELERDGQRRSSIMALVPQRFPLARIPFQLGFLGIGLFILVRAPGTRQARLTFLACSAQVIWHTRFDGGFFASYASLLIAEISAFPAIAATLYWAIHFPAEVPNQKRIPPSLAFALGLAWLATRAPRYLGGPVTMEQSQVARALVEVAFIAALLGVLTWNYRCADPIGRRRIKWCVVGLYVGLLPIMAALSLTATFPDFSGFDLLLALGWVLMLALPIGLLIGIARYNLFDIDRVISAAASYSALGAFAAAVALFALPRIASVGSKLVGVNEQTLQVALGLGTLALVLPLHRRLRPRLEQFFFPERRTLELGFGDLLAAIANARGAQDLARVVGEQLHRLLRPQSCAGFASPDAAAPFVPMFVHGRAVPQRFERSSPLIERLRRNLRPLVLDRPVVSELGAEHAELERLGAAVLLPLRRGDALAGFLYLGVKQSGDIYTSTDLARLTAVASAISSRLLAFDESAVIAEARTMQDLLRRYVPDAVADRLLAGEELESGEREVSVMFVDIRGYTELAQGKRAEEIFSLVNRYTRKVSEIVRAHGGSVVEFAGDGLMAVFGAPQDLEHKEQAAAETAREVCHAVAGLSVEGDAALSVGVGIATGLAFVGNIQATDRLIWSAIGNTTNLAARLQALTRELGAAIVVDATTRLRARQVTADFREHRETAIKGRQNTETVYALPA